MTQATCSPQDFLLLVVPPCPWEVETDNLSVQGFAMCAISVSIATDQLATSQPSLSPRSGLVPLLQVTPGSYGGSLNTGPPEVWPDLPQLAKPCLPHPREVSPESPPQATSPSPDRDAVERGGDRESGVYPARRLDLQGVPLTFQVCR